MLLLDREWVPRAGVWRIGWAAETQMSVQGEEDCLYEEWRVAEGLQTICRMAKWAT